MTRPTYKQIDLPASTPANKPLEVIVNSVTGDRMTILHSSYQNQGRYSSGSYAKIQFDLPPGAKGSPLHYHTKMDETFTVLKGSLTMEVGENHIRTLLKPGQSLQVRAKEHHSFCNMSSDWVTFTTENSPATGFEQFIRGFYGLAIDGKVNAAGMPTNILQLAVLLKLSDTIPADIPPMIFNSIVNLLVWIAKKLNVEKSLLKYW